MENVQVRQLFPCTVIIYCPICEKGQRVIGFVRRRPITTPIYKRDPCTTCVEE